MDTGKQSLRGNGDVTPCDTTDLLLSLILSEGVLTDLLHALELEPVGVMMSALPCATSEANDMLASKIE